MIFDEILEQYIQLSLTANQYKDNIKNLTANINLNNTNNSNIINGNFDIANNITSSPIEFTTKIKDAVVDVNSGASQFDIKDFCNRLELDARRYNRNFDSQIGALSR